MTNGCLWTVSLLLALLLPLEVLSQDSFNLADALDGDDDSKSSTPAPKPAIPAGGDFNLEDLLKDSGTTTTTTTTKAPPRVIPKGTTRPKAPVKPKPKPANDDLNLADALNPNNDIDGKEKNKGQGDRFTDSDLIDVSKDDTYKPDKGGISGGDGDQINHQDDHSETTAEVGTIAGIVSAVAMALVGAISSYISYQKKKLCFGIQQSLNTENVKAENPETVVATEPQVQQTLLEPSNAEPPTEENAV